MAFQNIRKKMFGKYLLLTNCTGMTLSLALGDVIEQQYVEKVLLKVDPKHEKEMLQDHGTKELPKDYTTSWTLDWNRTGRMASAGTMVGFLAHWLYRFLDGRFPGNAPRRVVTKALMDFAIGMPYIYMPVFTYWGMLEGKSAIQSAKEGVHKLPPMLAGEVVFWLPLRFVNFYFFKPHQRVIFNSSVNVVYCIFVSFVQNQYLKITHKEKMTEQPSESPAETDLTKEHENEG